MLELKSPLNWFLQKTELKAVIKARTHYLGGGGDELMTRVRMLSEAESCEVTWAAGPTDTVLFARAPTQLQDLP